MCLAEMISVEILISVQINVRSHAMHSSQSLYGYVKYIFYSNVEMIFSWIFSYLYAFIFTSQYSPNYRLGFSDGSTNKEIQSHPFIWMII